MTIECPKCKTNNPDSQKFCGECATTFQGFQDANHPEIAADKKMIERFMNELNL